MKRILFSLVLVILVLSVALVGYVAEEKLEWNENWPTKIRIGTGNIGGGSYMCGSTLRNVLMEEFPDIEVIVEVSHSSVANVKVMEAGDFEIATCTTEIAHDAWKGVDDQVFEGKKYQSFRILMPRTTGANMFITLKKYGITNVKQFTGKFSAGDAGGSNDIFVRKAFETLGVESEVINISISDSVDALRSGIIQGFVIGHPNPAVEELALLEDIEILGINGKDAETFLESNPLFSYPIVVPGGYYKGIDEPIEAVGVVTIFIARADLPEDMVYTILKAWYKHPEIIEATWPVLLKGTDPDQIKGISQFAPLHKGSIKYYEEIGAEIGEKAILLNE